MCEKKKKKFEKRKYAIILMVAYLFFRFIVAFYCAPEDEDLQGRLRDFVLQAAFIDTDSMEEV